VRTQIAGQLIEVAYKEGQEVKTGDFLAQIDPRPYQRQLDQYQGQLQRDGALLAEARINLERYRTLVRQDSIARQQLDTQESLVKQYEGVVETDKAMVDTAKLNLTYCHIVAPISGRVGLRQVDPGNYAQTNDTNGIVVITQMHPISVIFTLPEDNLPAVMKRLAAGASLPVTAFDRSHSTRLGQGMLTTVDNQIDTSTGTVKLRAVFDNADNLLFPNQFVNVRLLVDTLTDQVSIPAAAVQRGAPGTFVYLVKPDNTVAVKPVTLGPGSGDSVSVSDGLDAGDQVVVDGADKLKDGAQITLPAEGGGTDRKPAEGEHRHQKKQQP
ncbi:MAG TPA: efflux RND transporter periplasmic adaptor subunit, partial [Rhodospirillaceae bacterium]|nr:efflux RND transporter periplasmic adaptor subunit [Rhodospirillaceae bacterium]